MAFMGNEQVTEVMQVTTIAQGAADAAAPWAAAAPWQRASALVDVADAIDSAAGELIDVASRETALSTGRLTGEVKRTTGQLRMFAEVIVDGAYLDARIDEPDPDYALGPRPDLRRVNRPIGPVLNFAASNFPFAFSVAGGDSAAALAAGCPLIVKTHPGHPRLSRRTGSVIAEALQGTAAPSGVFQLVDDQQAGVDLLRDDRICAGTFTGSLQAGRLLADIAAARPRPVPFYAEMSSVNPVYVTPAAARADTSLLSGFVNSVTGSAGQLCTKPGFLFVPADMNVNSAVEAASTARAHALLNAHIGDGYRARRQEVLSTPGVRVLTEGSLTQSDDTVLATPTLVDVDLATLQEHRLSLLDECFGPLSILVRYDHVMDLPAVHRDLFPGNLTATLHATEADASEIGALVDALVSTSGRVLFGGWPTGVSVTGAMHHGGPYPAATVDATSVGTAAIGRFLRGVAYQDMPTALLPPPLRDDNPWNVPQRRGPAG